MTIPKRWRRFVEAVATGDLGRNGSLRDEADRMLSQDRASRRRVTAKAEPSRAFKAGVAEVRKANGSRARAVVMMRSGGGCELCGSHAHPNEWHHLAPGPLRRRYSATNATCAACPDCHRLWHRGDPDTLQRSYDLAVRIGAPDIVLAALNRRIDKATPPSE